MSNNFIILPIYEDRSERLTSAVNEIINKDKILKIEPFKNSVYNYTLIFLSGLSKYLTCKLSFEEIQDKL